MSRVTDEPLRLVDLNRCHTAPNPSQCSSRLEVRALCARCARDLTHSAVITTMWFMAGRKRLTTGIRFPEQVHERLKAAADERDLSINYLVVKAVEEFLDNLIPVEELRLTRSSN